MNGAITNLEFLTDRVRIHYQCATPWGVPDEVAALDVTYESIKALPSPPGLDHGFQGRRETWEESVFVPAEWATISLHFAQWDETDDFPMQALVGGPYLGNLKDAR